MSDFFLNGSVGAQMALRFTIRASKYQKFSASAPSAPRPTVSSYGRFSESFLVIFSECHLARCALRWAIWASKCHKFSDCSLSKNWGKILQIFYNIQLMCSMCGTKAYFFRLCVMGVLYFWILGYVYVYVWTDTGKIVVGVGVLCVGTRKANTCRTLMSSIK